MAELFMYLTYPEPCPCPDTMCGMVIQQGEGFIMTPRTCHLPVYPPKPVGRWPKGWVPLGYTTDEGRFEYATDDDRPELGL